MYLQQAPAETFHYMVLGFSVILSASFLYVLSLVVRFRKAESELKALHEVELKEESTQ